MSAGGRLLVGNLRCENDWAPLPARRGASASAQRAMVVGATLLRAFALPGDKLWLPGAPTGVVTPPYADLPSLPLLSGRLRGLTATALLAWGETAALEPLAARGRTRESTRGVATGPVHQAVWSLPRSSVEAARQANDRRWALALALDRGCALPGADVVETLAAARQWLERGGAAASPGDFWVLKAPHSASGRERVRGQGRHLPAGLESPIAALLQRFGALVCEPWMERVADFGVNGLLGDTGGRFLPPHRLHVDARGSFRGIDLRLEASGAVGLEAHEVEQLQDVARGVVASLQGLGYRGPFGIDCWRWRDRQGGVHFHPLGEINARMTFGLVARAVMERLVGGGMAAPSDRLELRFGTGSELATRAASGARVTPLAVSAAAAHPAAWAELEA